MKDKIYTVNQAVLFYIIGIICGIIIGRFIIGS